MCQPKKWWLGLLPLAFLVAIMIGLKSSTIEADLAERAQAELKTAGLGWASAKFSGRDGVLTGEAPTPDARELIAAAAERGWGVRTVENTATVAPEVKPYVVAVARDAAKLALTGNFPNDQTRAALNAALKAAVPSAEITDQLRFGRGASPALSPTLAFGTAQLAGLARGTMQVSDDALTITGQARDRAAYDSILKALAALPAGIKVAKAEITPPIEKPFTFGLAKAADGALSLSGFVPSTTVGDAVVAAAQKHAPGRVSGALPLADGLPDGINLGTVSTLAFDVLGKLKSGAATLTDKALSITGEAGDVTSFEQVRALLASAQAGGATVTQDIKPPPAVRPYVWSATRSTDGIVLSGYVPSEATRGVVVDAARRAFPSTTVKDELKLAFGLPDGVNLGGISSLAFDVLGKLKSGAASLTDKALSITGEAGDVTAFEQVRALLASAQAGGATVTQDIKPPPAVKPYVWSATSSKDGVILSGFVPSESARSLAVDTARKVFPSTDVKDQMKLGLGAPDGFLDAIKLGLEQLGKLASGAFSLSDGALKFEGEGVERSVVDAISQAFGSLGSKFSLANAVKALPPPAPPPPPALAIPPLRRPTFEAGTPQAICQVKFHEILEKDQIFFATASARITEESRGVVKLLAEAIQACPTMAVEIQGHTDADGDDAANLDLSNRRAAAVVEALKNLGIEADRMAAVGYGEGHPIAPNDTAEGKAKNRRIDFVVTR